MSGRRVRAAVKPADGALEQPVCARSAGVPRTTGDALAMGSIGYSRCLAPDTLQLADRCHFAALDGDWQIG